MSTLHCTLENGVDLYVNEHQKIQHYCARSTEEIMPNGYFYFRQCVRKLRYYSDVIQSLTFVAHARGLQNLVCLSVCVCVFSVFWHLAQSGIQTAVSATTVRYGYEI